MMKEFDEFFTGFNLVILLIVLILGWVSIDKLDTNTLRLKEKVERQQYEINNLKKAVLQLKEN